MLLVKSTIFGVVFIYVLHLTDTDYLKWIFPDYVKKTVFRVCYNQLGQKVSICDYWKGENERIRGLSYLELFFFFLRRTFSLVP